MKIVVAALLCVVIGTACATNVAVVVGFGQDTCNPSDGVLGQNVILEGSSISLGAAGSAAYANGVVTFNGATMTLDQCNSVTVVINGQNFVIGVAASLSTTPDSTPTALATTYEVDAPAQSTGCTGSIGEQQFFVTDGQCYGAVSSSVRFETAPLSATNVTRWEYNTANCTGSGTMVVYDVDSCNVMKPNPTESVQVAALTTASTTPSNTAPGGSVSPASPVSVSFTLLVLCTLTVLLSHLL